AVNSRFVLGTFSYAKLPMVKDLEGAVEAMAQHDLIAALAGNAEAREAVRERRGHEVAVSDPNHVPPADEFLVLDADATQNFAILISTLMARGQRVLFVAEKRAAIDAVLQRLADVKLDDLVLDLHGGASSRRATAQALAAALTQNARIARVDYRSDHERLQA